MSSAPTLTDSPVTFTENETIVLDAMFDALSYGRSRVLASQLAFRVESSPVKVRDTISHLRMKGVLIASDGRGFFFPQDGKEAERTARHLWSRVRAIAAVARAFDKAREQRYGNGHTFHQQVDFVFGEGE